jgi:hypothetical protein
LRSTEHQFECSREGRKRCWTKKGLKVPLFSVGDYKSDGHRLLHKAGQHRFSPCDVLALSRTYHLAAAVVSYQAGIGNGVPRAMDLELEAALAAWNGSSPDEPLISNESALRHDSAE